MAARNREVFWMTLGSLVLLLTLATTSRASMEDPLGLLRAMYGVSGSFSEGFGDLLHHYLNDDAVMGREYTSNAGSLPISGRQSQ